MQQACAGQGSVALIAGPAGIGKTSLLAAGRDLANSAGVQVLAARAGLLERDLPWNLVRQLFASVITAPPEEQAAVLAGACALATPALGLTASGPGAAAENGSLHGLYWLLNALVEEQVLLIAIDDAHWGDLPSLDFLAYLAERIADLPVLLVVTVRDGEEHPQQIDALALRAERLVLRALSVEASSELTRSALGAEAHDAFCFACHRVSAGNPFLLHELLAQLSRDQIEPSEARAGDVEQVTPESVKRMVLLRLSALPTGARDLGTAVALLDESVGLREAATVSGLGPPVASMTADALVAAGILAPGEPLRFVHPLVREAIYHDVQEHARARRHREAASALYALGADPDRVAVQLLKAATDGDPWVVERLREAARSALSEGAGQPAVDFLKRALEEPPRPGDRASVLRELATAEALVGSEAAMSHLEQALAVVEDPAEYEQIAVDLVLIRFRHGLMPPGLEFARQLIAQDAIKEPVLRMRVIAASVTGSILLPALRSHVEYFLDQIPPGIPDDSPEGRLALSARVADACARRAPMDEIGDLAEQALGGGSLLAELSAHELLYWNATSALTVSDRFEAARRAIEAALEESRRRGSAVGFALCSCFRCKLYQRVGDVTAGTADGWQAISVAPGDVPLIRAYTAAFLVELLVERGELVEALELLERPEFAGEVPPLFGYQLMRVSRGQARIAAGQFEAGVAEILEVGEELGEFEFGPAMCPWRARAVVGLHALGRHAEARRLAEEELSLARQSRSGCGETAALQALALVAREDAAELLERSLELCDEHGLALERARTLVLLGAHRRRAGARRDAAELLNHGLDAATACGALAIAEQARGELVAIGLSPRRGPRDGLDALTPAERRVADLAAGGQTNREIAQSLFVSLRTVETHLTHTYQKLGIESRAQLASALEAEPSSAPANRVGA